jgi:hypothetical protein
MFHVLNSFPVAFTDLKIIRHPVPVMTHPLDQNIWARKAKARKCAAKIAGNIQAKV